MNEHFVFCVDTLYSLKHFFQFPLVYSTLQVGYLIFIFLLKQSSSALPYSENVEELFQKAKLEHTRYQLF